MEGGVSSGGGCCIARYTHHPGVPNNTITYPYYAQDDVSKMDRIMLRFRPIAPKPATNGSASGSSTDDVKPNVVVGKRKRKANTTNTNTNTNKVVRNNNSITTSNKRRKSRSPDNRNLKGSSNGEKSCHVVTLPLLPETPDLSPRKNNYYYCNSNESQNSGICNKSSVPTWLCFGPSDEDLTTVPEVVPTSVTVEGVSDAWLDGNVLGGTDEERKRRLEHDTCPGFISDRWNRVWWTNEAYRRMATGEQKEDSWRGTEKVVAVSLREKVALPAAELYGAFTCRVRVQYGSHTMTVPCDVWRMNGGGFAWRLDIKAALSLCL